MQTTPSSLPRKPFTLGVGIACLVILCWAAILYVNLTFSVSYTSPWLWLRVLIQTHLFTGLFITAHDAMHGVVAPGRPKLNHFLGRLSAGLFIFNNYDKMRPKHYAHHRHVASDQDPDFHRGKAGFFWWYLDFVKEYVTWQQILLAAITFNIFKLLVGVPEVNLTLFWVVPSLLSTLQLFYFGTFLPHRGEHAEDNVHHARSQGKNHLWAFLSCYFFGYHYEHHDFPQTPWWRLWQKK